MASRCVARPIAGRDMSSFGDRVWLRGAFLAISRVGAACVIMGVQTMLMQFSNPLHMCVGYGH